MGGEKENIKREMGRAQGGMYTSVPCVYDKQKAKHFTFGVYTSVNIQNPIVTQRHERGKYEIDITNLLMCRENKTIPALSNTKNI